MNSGLAGIHGFPCRCILVSETCVRPLVCSRSRRKGKAVILFNCLCIYPGSRQTHKLVNGRFRRPEEKKNVHNFDQGDIQNRSTHVHPWIAFLASRHGSMILYFRSFTARGEETTTIRKVGLSSESQNTCILLDNFLVPEPCFELLGGSKTRERTATLGWYQPFFRLAVMHCCHLVLEHSISVSLSCF